MLLGLHATKKLKQITIEKLTTQQGPFKHEKSELEA